MKASLLRRKFATAIATLTGAMFLTMWLPAAQAQPAPQPPPALPTDEELEVAEVRIGSITIDAGEIFDAGENAPTRLADLTDRLHINTREGTIRSQLLFSSGDRYQSRVLQESERLLRATSYLGDARIYPVALHDGVVDVLVRTRDVWTLDFSGSFGRRGGENSSGLQLQDSNLAGLGLRLGLNHKNDVDRSSNTLMFRAPQIGRQRWALDASVGENSDGYERELLFGRSFYALDTRWAVGVRASTYARRESRYAFGQIVDEYNSSGSDYELFAGNSAGLRNGWVTRWTYGFSASAREFSPAPANENTLAVTPGAPPDERRFLYPWLGWQLIQDEYTTEHNHDQIGKVEDWHAGWQLRARVGYASETAGSTSDALLWQAELTRGVQFGGGRLLDLRARVDGRLEDGVPVDALGSLSARYYVPTSRHSTLFLGASADFVRQADGDRQLLLGGDNGLRGYPLRYLESSGSDKARWLISVEQRWFPTWSPWSIFNVGATAFYDAGAAPGSGQGVLQDVGLGLRLSNNRSAHAGVVHIDLALPLNGGPGVQGLQLLVSTKKRF